MDQGNEWEDEFEWNERPTTPEELKHSFVARSVLRAHSAGKTLCAFSIGWGALTVIGGIIMASQRECGQAISDSACDGDFTHPYVIWSIASVLVNIFFCVIAYAIGSYIEARMAPQIAEVSSL